MALNHSDRVAKGHLLDEMIYDCVFAGGGCNLEKLANKLLFFKLRFLKNY